MLTKQKPRERERKKKRGGIEKCSICPGAHPEWYKICGQISMVEIAHRWALFKRQANKLF